MTRFIDTHIPVDPRHPDALNPAWIYLAHIAWPHQGEQQKRERFVGALLAAQYKATGRHLPPGMPPIKREDIAGVVKKGLFHRMRRRQAAFAMILHRFAQLKIIDLPNLKPDQRERLVKLNAIDALLDPDGDFTGKGEPFLSDRDRENIRKRIWFDSLPALAMFMGLRPMRLAGEKRHIADLIHDASWVRDAVYDARIFAFMLEHAIAPPTLLLPRRLIVPSSVTTHPVRPTALARLLYPRGAAKLHARPKSPDL